MSIYIYTLSNLLLSKQTLFFFCNCCYVWKIYVHKLNIYSTHRIALFSLLIYSTHRKIIFFHLPIPFLHILCLFLAFGNIFQAHNVFNMLIIGQDLCAQTQDVDFVMETSTLVMVHQKYKSTQYKKKIIIIPLLCSHLLRILRSLSLSIFHFIQKVFIFVLLLFYFSFFLAPA